MVAAESSEGETARIPVHLWIVGVLSLLWNFMGAYNYLASQLKLEFYMEKLTPEQLEYFYNIPWWAVAGWATGVWFALAGSIGLLMRKKWSICAFGISIVGLLVSTIHSFVVSNWYEIMGTSGVAFSLVIWVIAIGLFLYARAMGNKGVLS